MMSLRERVIWAAADEGLGRKYGHTGIDTVDCIRFALAILMNYRLFGHLSFDVRTMYLSFDGAHGSFANVSEVVRLGVGESVDEPEIGYWHYCQRWRYNTTKKRWEGHCFMLWCGRGSGLLILESTNVNSDWLRPTTWDEVSHGYTVKLAKILPNRLQDRDSDTTDEQPS